MRERTHRVAQVLLCVSSTDRWEINSRLSHQFMAKSPLGIGSFSRLGGVDLHGIFSVSARWADCSTRDINGGGRRTGRTAIWRNPGRLRSTQGM